MRRVCFFNSVRFWGGGEKLHLDNALGFQKLGYDVVVACDKNSVLWQRASAAGLNCIHVQIRNLTFANPFAMAKLKRLFIENEIDTVVFTTSQDVKAGAIAAKRAGVSRIVYLRGLAVPIKNNAVNRKLFSETLTHIVANSIETKKLMLKHLGDVNTPKPVEVIYHGIDLPKSTDNAFITALKNKSHGIIIGNAGRLTKQKGQQHIITVAKLLKEKQIDFTIFIAGDGEEKEALTQMISENHLEQHVILLGFVEQMDAFMQSLDIFVLTSMWEGFGFAIVEAMSHQKPVVAFDISSNPEIIAHNETGILVQAGDDAAMADAIKHLIENQALRLQMGEAGKNRMMQHFLFEDKVRELADFINS